MKRNYIYSLLIIFISSYCSLVFADQSNPAQAPGVPFSFKFWDLSDKKDSGEIQNTFNGNMDRYRYFVEVSTNVEDTHIEGSENYLISADGEMGDSNLDLFGKIMILENLDKTPRERKMMQKIRSFLRTNYKTQVLPYEVYDNEHLPRPFYLYQLKDWVFGAVDKNDINLLRALLDNYNLIDIKNKDGYGLLSYAALHQRPDIVRFMIRRGANLNETNTLKETPLMIAVKNNNLEIVYMLARSGCDVNQKDRFGHSSIDKAKTNNSSQIHEYLSSITNK